MSITRRQTLKMLGAALVASQSPIALASLKIPAWYGAMIGHLEKKFTVPLGINAEIDADTGSILLLEPSVS